MTMLHRFYAVTLTSIYLVKDRRSKDDPCPVAKKIAIKGDIQSVTQNKIAIGTELKNGTMIAITHQLQAYIPEGGGMTSFCRKIEGVNTRWWGGHSSAIVALFTQKKDAMKCLSNSDLEECDPRWINSTKSVIE